MTGFVRTAAGEVWQLPAAEQWELEYGLGTPCDCFFLRCPWQWGQGTVPGEWAQFYAEQDGARVFTGVVDECEASLTAEGCFLELSGRGMAALLLDNEALGQDYQIATLADILRGHVTPYGIETVGGGQLSHVSTFRVDTGSSEWTVLEEFLHKSGGGLPRFDEFGRLILSEFEDGNALCIGADTPISTLVRRDRRYGVLSQVLVRDRYSGAVQRVENEEFSNLGGAARRVLTMPGHANSAAMLEAGREQLERSARGWQEVEVTLPLPFAAMPGQLVELERSGLDHSGTYRVARVAVGMNENGYWSRLTLRKPEYVR